MALRQGSGIRHGRGTVFQDINPEAQAEKFGPKMEYPKRWVPELGPADYPEPMVNHK